MPPTKPLPGSPVVEVVEFVPPVPEEFGSPTMLPGRLVAREASEAKVLPDNLSCKVVLNRTNGTPLEAMNAVRLKKRFSWDETTEFEFTPSLAIRETELLTSSFSVEFQVGTRAVGYRVASLGLLNDYKRRFVRSTRWEVIPGALVMTPGGFISRSFEPPLPPLPPPSPPEPPVTEFFARLDGPPSVDAQAVSGGRAYVLEQVSLDPLQDARFGAGRIVQSFTLEETMIRRLIDVLDSPGTYDIECGGTCCYRTAAVRFDLDRRGRDPLLIETCGGCGWVEWRTGRGAVTKSCLSRKGKLAIAQIEDAIARKPRNSSSSTALQKP